MTFAPYLLGRWSLPKLLVARYMVKQIMMDAPRLKCKDQLMTVSRFERPLFTIRNSNSCLTASHHLSSFEPRHWVRPARKRMDSHRAEKRSVGKRPTCGR